MHVASTTTSSVALHRGVFSSSLRKRHGSRDVVVPAQNASTSTTSMRTTRCEPEKDDDDDFEDDEGREGLKSRTLSAKQSLVATSLAVTMSLASPFAALADRGTEMRLPPIDKDPNRCERAFVGNTIGQANAVSDKTLDLRECKYDNVSVKGITLSGALMVDSVFDNSDFSETVMSKVYAKTSSFKNVNFTNAVIDRATFDGSDMTGANFQNAVLTGVSYEGANLTGANFEEALIGDQDVKLLCLNPTVVDESRLQIGCRN
jgi:hypothetical protein